MSTQAVPTSAIAKNLILQLGFSHGVFGQNTEGITEDEAFHSPTGGGNCMNWIGGHLLGARDGVRAMLGLDPVLSPEVAKRYQRGSAPITAGGAPLSWSEIVELWNASQGPIAEALTKMTDEDLARPLPEDRNPFRLDSVGEQLATLAFHEAYHVGQLGVLRRACGREGAIR